uniref:Aquaporin-1 n=1 Tax=Milnesium tardigradum TaxID=46460 RepID=AQP1_MILTA|nr:RecName: Full=Aquaporin-1; Short=AQP-1 [Milnesium tardigradum]AEP14555.1 aquaporin 1 [Milnesium tardigradum]
MQKMSEKPLYRAAENPTRNADRRAGRFEEEELISKTGRHPDMVIQFQDDADDQHTSHYEGNWRHYFHKKLHIKNRLIRDWLSESLAMFLFMSLLLGGAATAHFTGKQDDPMLTAVFHGFSAVFGIYVGAGVSGGIINPALTFAVALLGRVSWRKCLVLVSAQYFGSFIASAVVYLIYYESLQNYAKTADDNGEFLQKTAGIWSTFPKPYLSMTGAIFNQIFCTMLLSIGFLSISDHKNFRPTKGLFPFAVGLLIMTVFLAFSYSAGAAMNPARDLSPRLWSLIIGYGNEVFSHNDYKWFWIPWLFPYVGALFGAVMYQIFVGVHWPDKQSTKR